MRKVGLILPVLGLSATLVLAAAEPCRITVVEKGTGWPVPLVELRTTHNMRFVTDNAGVVAFDLPELMGRETFFYVIGHGYEMPKDGFGYRGVRLTPKPGGSLKVEIPRTMVAKRLGRVTGAGLFAESQKLGQELDWPETRVLGCDSVQNALYRGRMFWLWGDTTLAHYPLGIFDSSSATTTTHPLANFEPPLRVRFDYFTDAKGAPRGVAKMPGSGPTWLSAYTSLPDKTGSQRLVATYAKTAGHLDMYEQGLCVWDDATSNFVRHRVLWTKAAGPAKPPPAPDGHPAFWKDAEGKSWIYYGNPLPVLRCPATLEGWDEAAKWETLQPQKTLVSATDGQAVRPHTGMAAYNPYRKRWVTIFLQANGKPSALGEVWYAEADAPAGPWGKAVKVLTHENYTFYNPRLHPEFTADNSPILLFEGSYTQEFANHAAPTPRYDYNQVLYRLDLDDPALAPARAR
jgi:hypothetical protein